VRFEPFILACECGSLEIAKDLVRIGRQAGFRESGIVLGKDRINVTVRSSARLEIPICHDSTLLVPKTYLEFVHQISTERYNANLCKVGKFHSLFREAFLAPQGLKSAGVMDMYNFRLEPRDLAAKSEQVDNLLYFSYDTQAVWNCVGGQAIAQMGTQCLRSFRQDSRLWRIRWTYATPTTR